MVWHPASAVAAGLADAVFRAFCVDPDRPLDPSLELPVAFGWAGESQPRPPAPMHHTPDTDALPVLVLLIDDQMIAQPEGAFAEAAGGLEGVLSRWLDQPGRLLLTVQVSVDANRLHVRLRRAPSIPLYDRLGPGMEPDPMLIARLGHELARAVFAREADRAPRPQPAPICLYISHARVDGAGVASELINYLESTGSVKDWCESSSIDSREEFEELLKGWGEPTVMVALHTDAWPSRPWCRWEASLARDLDLPLLVVEAGEKGGDDSYPYPGAATRLRWRGAGSSPEVVEAATRVALRWGLNRARLDARMNELKAQAKGDAAPIMVVPHAPDLVDGMRAIRECGRADPVLLYPNPPMCAREHERLRAWLPQIRLLAASETLDTHPAPLPTDLLVQLSVSEPEDLIKVGAGDVHVAAVQIALARALLERGGRIAYGGDLRTGGFTLRLFHLVEAANRRRSENRLAPIEAIVGWPQSLQFDPATWAPFARTANRTTMPVPKDDRVDPAMLSPKGEIFYANVGDAQRYAWARGLSELRLALAGPPRRNDDERRAPARDQSGKPIPEAKALVALGGRTRGFAGTVPGVLEEIVLCCRAQKPVYLCAGFGGATAIAAALLGLPAPISQDEALRTLRAIDRAHASAHRWAAAGAPLPLAQELGLELTTWARAELALGNGLDPPDYERLALSTEPTVIIGLVLRGLRSVSAG